MRSVAELGPEPAPERDAEPGLAPAGDLGRQLRGERPPERDLSLAAVRLQRIRQREAESDDLMVEERRAQLQRVGHGREVRLQQQVARQIRLDVQQL